MLLIFKGEVDYRAALEHAETGTFALLTFF